LLPVGIPLLGIARRLITSAVRLMLPRSLAHPIDEVSRTVTKKVRGPRGGRSLWPHFTAGAKPITYCSTSRSRRAFRLPPERAG
jgi:hypothetical protein